MTALGYVGTSLTITASSVILDIGEDSGERGLAYASIDEVRVYPHALGTGARLVVASPRMVLAKDYAEAGMARQAARIVVRAMNDRGAFTRSQRMRGEHPATNGGRS